ncbi:MAG: hypothetical protein HY905_16790 [Deltaproteobacteria bacterium]|nr:hypothetical protein [Deltaproteobacteria bacterium]
MSGRGRIVGVVVAVLLVAVAPSARGTEEPEYLSQFVLMMDWVNRAIVYVPRHTGDRNLAEVAHAVAEVLVTKSERLTPPERLSDLHPHFVLVLENAERAFAYLAEGESDKAERHLALVRDEMRIMRQVQRDIGIEIPELAL